MTKDHEFPTAHRMADLPDEGEPLPIFQNLPEIDLGTDDLTDMKRSVHELIHARAVEAAIEEGHGATALQPARRSSVSSWARRLPRRLGKTLGKVALEKVTVSAGLRVAAAFAAVALATSLLVPAFAPQPLEVAGAPLLASGPTSAELAEIESLPLVENLGSAADLIQIEDDEMSLVVAAIQ